MTPDAVSQLAILIYQYYFAVITPLAGVYVAVLIFRRITGV